MGSPRFSPFGFSTHAQGLRLRRVHLALCPFSRASDVAFPLSGQGRAHGKKGFRAQLPGLRFPGRTLKHDVVTAVRTSAGKPKSMAYSPLILRKKETFILYPKTVLSGHTLTPVCAPSIIKICVSYRRICGYENVTKKSSHKKNLPAVVAEGELVIHRFFFTLAILIGLNC